LKNKYYRVHEATFKPPHNWLKSKTLIVLFDRAVLKQDSSGLTVRELAEQSGCNPKSLQSRIAYWVKWKYVARRPSVDNNGRLVWVYAIATRGIEFVQIRLPDCVRNEMIAEIKTTRKRGPG
jgi:hypothetical protein